MNPSLYRVVAMYASVVGVGLVGGFFAPKQGPEEPRLGLAVPKAVGSSVERNRIKRRLREVWRAKLDAAAVDTRRDYVIVVRPGLPEAAEARGHLWLAERVDEVLAKAAA